ncbi:hypothetical protein [Psychrobacter celer]|uniref:hypothetical protein n=1 Tax=Psychrobacter celer TaxID=306572 RepID=UPI003FCFA13B
MTITNDSKAPKKPTKYNKDGTEKTQKQINDAWKAYYDHKHKVEAEALARQKEEDKSFFDKAKDFLGFDDDAQADNAINTARNAAVTGAKLPGTGTMAAGDTLLGAGPSVYGGFDTELRKDYDYFVREGRLPDKPGASALPAYEKARQRINKEFVEKHKGADWTEPGKDGRSPQNDIWGK